MTVDELARTMPTCMDKSAWGSDLHWELRYEFGTIHEHRCIPMARAILERLEKETEEAVSGEPPCDRIVNNGMGEPTECGRLYPCEYHDAA